MSVILCKETLPRVTINIYADVKEGKLKISGQDLGAACEDCFGESEYEYFYDFDEQNTLILLNKIKADAAIEEMLELIKDRFSGVDGCKILREFCEEKNVKYSFFSC